MDFWLGDCFDLFPHVADGSVDMVLCDLPYGTTQNKWDSVLPLDRLWREYWRVCRPGAAIVLTAQMPFSATLVCSQLAAFKYEWVWDRVNKNTNFLNAKHQPMRRHETIQVFAKSRTTYNPQMVERSEPYVTRRTQSLRSSNYGVAEGTSSGILVTHDTPCSVLSIPGNMTTGVVHPTQKPVALFEYLIRTYTNPGDLVLDNTAGSGTTAVAAINTDRRWICMERDPDYYGAAMCRVMAAIDKKRGEG